MLIDTHCHLEKEYYPDLDSVVSNMDGMMITAGCDAKSNKETLECIKKYSNVYGVLGIHPEFVDSYTKEDLDWIEEHINDLKIVGIGEVGLDYHYDDDNKELQKELFEAQIKLAKKYNKPVVVHSRDAIMETLEIMKKYSDVSYVLHCYGGSLEMAKEFMKLNCMFGIGGVVTFKNGKKLVEVVDYLPLDRILLETDSPYLTPEPHRGDRNEPKNTYFVASKIAEIKNKSIEEIIEITKENAKTKFDL